VVLYFRRCGRKRRTVVGVRMTDNVIPLKPANDTSPEPPLAKTLKSLLEDARAGKIAAATGALFTSDGGIGYFAVGPMSICAAVGGLEYAKMRLMCGDDED
jgi:hypothetical protein